MPMGLCMVDWLAHACACGHARTLQTCTCACMHACADKRVHAPECAPTSALCLEAACPCASAPTRREEDGRERRARFLAGRLLGHTLSNGFVCMLISELLDELEEAAGEMNAAAAAAATAAASPHPPAAAAGGASAEQREGLSSATGPALTTRGSLPSALELDEATAAPTSPPTTSAASALLGQRVPAGALVQGLVGVGLQAADAVRVVSGLLGCGATGAASFAEALVGAWQHGMLDGVPVWSNLAMATARATALLQRPGTHDVRGMLAWVDQRCASLMGTSCQDGEAGEGEGWKEQGGAVPGEVGGSSGGQAQTPVRDGMGNAPDVPRQWD